MELRPEPTPPRGGDTKLGGLHVNKTLMTTAVATLALGAAFASPASAQDKIGACLITKTDTNPFFVKMKEGATEAAAANGINLSTFAGKYDGDVETQVAAVETCIASGAKGILITPTDSRALVPVITQAREAAAQEAAALAAAQPEADAAARASSAWRSVSSCWAAASPSPF